MRRFATIISAILVLLALAWTGGWFALAQWAEGQVSWVLAETEQRGVTVDCAGRDFVGFPFAMKLACGEATVSERGGGATAEFAQLTGGASIFAPRTARIEIGSPARLDTPLLDGPAEARWTRANVDVGLGVGGPRSASFTALDIDASSPLGALSAKQAEAMLAPAENGGTIVATEFRSLAVSAAGLDLPPVDGEASAWLSAPPRALLAGRAALRPPLNARDIRLLLRIGASRIAADGELSVDAEGILDGVVRLRIAEPQDLSALIAALPADQQKLGNAAIGGMLAFSQPSTLDGAVASELVVEIVRGEAKVGPISVTAPRLQF